MGRAGLINSGGESGKNDFAEVAVYAGVLSVLLGWRLWHGWATRAHRASRA